MCTGLYLDIINIDARTKCVKNPPIYSQAIEHKQNSDD